MFQDCYWVKRYNSTTQRWMSVHSGIDYKKANEVYESYIKFAKRQDRPIVRLFRNREIITEF